MSEKAQFDVIRQTLKMAVDALIEAGHPLDMISVDMFGIGFQLAERGGVSWEEISGGFDAIEERWKGKRTKNG